MRPPKQNAHFSLIGTILIMWLMVGYVYLLDPPQPVTAGSVSALRSAPVLPKATVEGLPRDGDGVNGLTLGLAKAHYLPAEPVVVIARLRGPESPHGMASLLIENGTQVLGPLTFTQRSGSDDYIVRIVENPATGLPLAEGNYKVVVQVGADWVAAVSFDVRSQSPHLAFQP